MKSFISFIITFILMLPITSTALSAKSYIVMDMEDNVLMELNANQPRSIASIAKIFTTNKNMALSMEELITILPEDVKAGRMRSSPLRAGMQVDRQTLIKLALVSSDNIAAIALGRFGTLLDLPSHTTIIEASGLDNRNKSTARDLAMFVKSLHNSDLANISVQKTATFRSIERRSTNPLIEKRGWNFLLSKTGFTNPAGGCLVVIAEVKQKFLIFVILGASNTKQRWRDLAELRTKIQGDTNFYIPQIVKNVKKQHRKVKRKQR